MKHIPSNAVEKTDYVHSLGIKRSRWFVLDGKVYSSNKKSIWNGTDWMEFCELMSEVNNLTINFPAP